MEIDKQRELAVKILFEVTQDNAYSNLSLSKRLDQSGLKDVERAFVTELTYGTIRYLVTIDATIEKFSSIKLKKISPWILNILRIGVYQLLFTNKIPASAACNESVKLAKRYGHAASSGFVNGVLRSISKTREIPCPIREINESAYLQIKYSFPKWLVDRWLERYGGIFTEELLLSMNQNVPTCVRVNTNKVSADKLIEILKEEGIETRKGKYLDECLYLINSPQISSLNSFLQGMFTVQDESSMMAVRVLDPKPDECVIDLCAAPGGKTGHMAELMQNKGTVFARDIHPHKIKLIEEGAKRLSATIIHAKLSSAVDIDTQDVTKADRVLLDAPCSGLGIIRRKPDIKWKRRVNDISSLAILQHQMLTQAAKLVKEGGVLVYSTCTLEPEENTGHIEPFLKENPDFFMEDITSLVPDSLNSSTAQKGFIDVFPNREGLDGFFIARFRKRELQHG